VAVCRPVRFGVNWTVRRISVGESALFIKSSVLGLADALSSLTMSWQSLEIRL
jgi:hypothetical protein